MNKVCRCSIILLLIILIFAQIFCINKIKKDNNINACSAQNNNYKTIAQISDELSCLKDKTILSATETDGKWYVKVRIDGNKDELKNEILKLRKYDIGNYIMSKNKKEEYTILEINAR